MSIYITFLLYFLIIFIIGYKAYRATKTNADYILGGRKLNSIVTALGVGASDMSGWLMIALPGAIYLNGLYDTWMPIGLFICAFLNWTFVAHRLRIFTIEYNNSITLPEYFENRFKINSKDNSKIIRTISAIVIIIFFTIYTAAGFVSSGLLFSATFGIDYHYAVLIGVVLLVLYTSIGGFLAVNWIDVFQGSLMLIALICLPIYILYLLDIINPSVLSLEYLKFNYSEQFNQNYFSFLDYEHLNYVYIIGIVSTLSWGLGYFGMPHILVRFMASESKQSIKKARNICMTWMGLALIGSIAIGFIGKLYYLDSPLGDPEKVFFKLVDDAVNHWLSGWLLAAVLSCVLSTTSAQLLLTSSALCEDLYINYINPNASDKLLLNLGRVTVIVVALVALIFSWNKDSSVLDLVSYGWAGLGSAFGPLVLFSLFWSKITRIGAIFGIASGALSVLTILLIKSLYPGSIIIYEIIPGFIISSIFIIFISKLTYNQNLAENTYLTRMYYKAKEKC